MILDQDTVNEVLHTKLNNSRQKEEEIKKNLTPLPSRSACQTHR